MSSYDEAVSSFLATQPSAWNTVVDLGYRAATVDGQPSEASENCQQILANIQDLTSRAQAISQFALMSIQGTLPNAMRLNEETLGGCTIYIQQALSWISNQEAALAGDTSGIDLLSPPSLPSLPWELKPGQTAEDSIVALCKLASNQPENGRSGLVDILASRPDVNSGHAENILMIEQKKYGLKDYEHLAYSPAMKRLWFVTEGPARKEPTEQNWAIWFRVVGSTITDDVDIDATGYLNGRVETCRGIARSDRCLRLPARYYPNQKPETDQQRYSIILKSDFFKDVPCKDVDVRTVIAQLLAKRVWRFRPPMD